MPDQKGNNSSGDSPVSPFESVSNPDSSVEINLEGNEQKAVAEIPREQKLENAQERTRKLESRLKDIAAEIDPPLRDLEAFFEVAHPAESHEAAAIREELARARDEEAELNTEMVKSFEQERAKLIQGLKDRYKENEINLAQERKFVEDLWGCKATADVIIVTPEQFAEEFSGNDEVVRLDESSAFYSGDLNMIVIKRQPEFGQLDEFFVRERAVHELTHATQGRSAFIADPREFQPGDTFVTEVEEGRFHAQSPRIGSRVTNIVSIDSEGSDQESEIKAWGLFLEEAMAVYSEFAWMKSQAESQTAPEDIRDLPTVETSVPIQLKGVDIPWYGWRVTEEGGIATSHLRLAAMGLELLLEADPSLLDALKGIRQGDVNGMRLAVQRIDNLLGRGSYAELQRFDGTTDLDDYYHAGYELIKRKLAEKKS